MRACSESAWRGAFTVLRLGRAEELVSLRAREGSSLFDPEKSGGVGSKGRRSNRALRVFAGLAVVAMVLGVLNPVVVQMAVASPTLQTSSTGPMTNNGTAPPPPPPPPPPAPVPQSVPSGTVSQAWQNDSPIQMKPHWSDQFINSSDNLTWVTDYGTFSVNRTRPYWISLARLNGQDFRTLFSIEYGGVLLFPTNGTLYVGSTKLLEILSRFSYGSLAVGTLDVKISFGPDTDKASLVFRPAGGVVRTQVQLVWLGFTTYGYVFTNSLVDTQTSFSLLPSFANVGNLDDVVTLEPQRDYPFKIFMDFTDAQANWSATYAGHFSFGGFSGNAVLVTFLPGNLTVDPVLVASTSGSAATEYSSQRKTFFDGQQYWLFYSTGPIQFASSVDGKTWSTVGTVPGTSGGIYSADSFTVATFGNQIVVLWVDATYHSDIDMAVGRLNFGWIEWSPHTPFSSALTAPIAQSCTIPQPVTATFTPQGQLVISYIMQGGTFPVCSSPGNEVWLARATCTATNGFPCDVVAIDGPHGLGNRIDSAFSITSPPGPYSYSMTFPVAFQGDQGEVVDFFAAANSSLFVYGEFLSASVCASTISWTLDSLHGLDPKDYFAATPMALVTGITISAFFMASASNFNINQYLISPNCTTGSQGAIYNDGYPTQYMTAGTQADGQTAYLFFSARTSASGKMSWMHYIRIPSSECCGGRPQEETVPWATTFTNPTEITVAPSSSRFAPLLFTTPAGYVYYSNFPLPTDSSAAPSAAPWAQSAGSDLLQDLGGIVNPANGLLSVQAGFASIQGRGGTDLALSFTEQEPGLYYQTSTGSDTPLDYYDIPTQYGSFLPAMHLDLPWLDLARGSIHLQGGSEYFIDWNAYIPSTVWFNNSAGVHFTLAWTTSGYALTLASGAYYTFDYNTGVVLTESSTVSGLGNVIHFVYQRDASNNPLLLTGITDAVGRSASVTIANGQITGIAYGSEHATFSYAGAIPAGCPGTTSDSNTMTMTDALQRQTVYIECEYRVTEVDFPTGGKVVYTYGSASLGSISQGTDVYSLPLLQEDVYSGAGTKARALTFTYHAQNGEVVLVQVKFYDANGVLQGIKEFRYRSNVGLVSTRIIDATGQALYYDMETTYTCGTSTCMKDLSGNPNSGTITGTSTSFGRWGKSQYFNGAAFISAASAASLNPSKAITIAGWFNLLDTNNRWGISKWQSGTCTSTHSSYALMPAYGTTGGKPMFIICSGSGVDYDLLATASLPTGTWKFLAATFNVGTLTLYVDDGTHLTAPYVGTAPFVSLNSGSTDPVVIGAESYGLAPMYGNIDEVRIYNRALSSDEILSLYNDNLVQRTMSQDWYSLDGQPHVAQTYSGDETTPSATTLDFVDDWGNVIYRKDALGNESFQSFANTNHQYQFYAPGSLSAASQGLLYANGFDAYTEDLYVQKGTPNLALDDAAFDRYMPSLRIDPVANQDNLLVRTFAPQSVHVVLEANVRFSAVSTSDLNQEFNMTLRDSAGVAHGGVEFAQGALYYLPYGIEGTWSSCFIAYAANTWYRVTLVADIYNDTYSVYLDGIRACSGGATNSGAVDRFWIGAYYSTAAFSAWIDDARVTSGWTITVTGLRPGQTAFLFSADRATLIDAAQASQANGGKATLSFVRLQAYAQGQDVLRLSGPDGTLEYEYPLKTIYGGDVYSYTPPKTLDDALVRTTYGYGSWRTLILDEPPLPAGSTAAGQWNWLVAPAVSGTHVHASAFIGNGASVQSHSFTGGVSASPGSSDYFVQYVYLNSSLAPFELVLRYYDSTKGVWQAAYWGSQLDTSLSGAKNMGPVPPTRDGWTQLVVAASDLSLSGDTITGFWYEIAGGQALWDATALAGYSAGTISVSGLAQLGGAVVVVRWANNGTEINAVDSGLNGDSATVSLYPYVRAFPVSVRIEIDDRSNFVNNPNPYVYYQSAPRSIWGGDVFRYLGKTGFYDPGLGIPTSTVHASRIGSKAYVGDCRDAILCYDMESLTTDVPPQMADLSLHGENAVPHGNLQFAPASSSASGLGLSFDGATYLQASDSAGLDTPALSLSTWLYPTSFPSSYNRIIEHDYWTNTKQIGWTVLYDGTAPLGRVYMAVFFGGVGETDSPRVQLVQNALNHVAFTFDGTYICAYLNGAQVGTCTKDTQTYAAATGNPLYVGAGAANGIFQYYTGYIDQVALYSSPLSPAQISGLYRSRLPNARESYVLGNSNGLPIEVRVPYQGAYLVADYNYDPFGNLVKATDLGRGQAGPNATQYYYSGLNIHGYPTTVIRPDGRKEVMSYNFTSGLLQGTVAPDCRRIRNGYDAAGRPTTTSYYDVDPNAAVYLDMETPDDPLSASAQYLMDVSCNGNSALVHGTTDAAGIDGRAQAFGGSSYLLVPSPMAGFPSGSMTLAAWVKGTGVVFDEQGSGAPTSGWHDSQMEVLSTGTVMMSVWPYTTKLNCGTITTTDWHFLALTYDASSTTLTCYADAASKGTATFARSSSGATTYVIGIGDSTNLGSGAYFAGAIDEVRVEKYALSPAEVQALFAFKFKLLARTAAAFDDMTNFANFASSVQGYTFPVVTTYDAASIPRVLFFDMQTAKFSGAPGLTDTLEDLSGNGNDGTLQGGTFATMSQVGKIGNALKFANASQQWIDVPDRASSAHPLDLTGPMTVAAWINPTGTSTFNPIVAKGYLGSLQYYMDVHKFGSSFYLEVAVANAAGISKVQSATTIPTNSWTHVAFTYDGGTVLMYINGKADANSLKVTMPLAVYTQYDLTIGVYPGGLPSYSSTAWFDGLIDEVHLLATNLTASQISALYAATEPTHMTKRYFDGLGRETKDVFMDLFGHSIVRSRTFLWDDQPGSETVPSGQQYTYTYDFLGRPLSTTFPGDGSMVLTNYYDRQRKAEFVDQIGRVSYGVRDSLGRVVQEAQRNPSNGTYNLTRLGYDALGDVVTQDVLLPSGSKQQPTTYVYYDALGDRRFVLYPDGTNSTVAYDNDVRFSVETDRMGRVTTLAYDNLGRIKSASVQNAPGATSYTATYAYDGSDNLAIIDNGTARVYRVFDGLRRMTQEWLNDGTYNLSMKYQYDAAGKVLGLTYPDGLQVSYLYDTLGRPVEVDLAGLKYAAVSYDGAGRLYTITYYNGGGSAGPTETYLYDARDRVTQLTVAAGSTTFLGLTYTYDLASEITKIVDSATGYTETYAYDGQGRLSQATGPWTAQHKSDTISYAYDAVGNILSKTDGGSATTYAYTAWNELKTLSGATSATFTYNAEGSATQKIVGSAVTSYTYDFSQRLVKVVAGTSTSTHAYDALGRRVTTADSSGTTYFAYLGQRAAYAQLGTAKTDFVYLGSKLLLRSDSGGAHFSHQDLSGNARVITSYSSKSKAFVAEAKYLYKPFGEVIVLTSPSTDPRFKFAGQELDSTGLYHMGARYYDPSLGRFMSRDPIGSGYAYAYDDPLSFVDPSGLRGEQPGINGGIVVLPAYYNAFQPLLDFWNSIPPFWRDVIVIVAVAAITIATAGTADIAIAALAVGVAAGAAFAAYTYATTGTTDPQRLFDSFATGFTLGAGATQAAFAVAGVVRGLFVGSEIAAAAAEEGSEIAGEEAAAEATSELGAGADVPAPETPAAQAAADGGTQDLMTLQEAEAKGVSGRVLVPKGTVLDRAAVQGREFGMYYTPKTLMGLTKEEISAAVNPEHEFTYVYRFVVRADVLVDFNPVSAGGTLPEVIFESSDMAEAYLRYVGEWPVG